MIACEVAREGTCVRCRIRASGERCKDSDMSHDSRLDA